ncbi:hypothetical protein HDU98_001524, partial [Podochytrium sp. JEL0797]
MLLDEAKYIQALEDRVRLMGELRECRAALRGREVEVSQLRSEFLLRTGVAAATADFAGEGGGEEFGVGVDGWTQTDASTGSAREGDTSSAGVPGGMARSARSAGSAMVASSSAGEAGVEGVPRLNSTPGNTTANTITTNTPHTDSNSTRRKRGRPPGSTGTAAKRIRTPLQATNDLQNQPRFPRRHAPTPADTTANTTTNNSSEHSQPTSSES